MQQARLCREKKVVTTPSGIIIAKVLEEILETYLVIIVIRKDISPKIAGDLRRITGVTNPRTKRHR